MDSQQISGSTISTDGLTGCYVFLVSGLFLGIPFCYLNHHSYSPELVATTPPSLLLAMIEYLVECLIGEMRTFIGSAPVSDLIDSMSSLSLFIGGGIQEDSDTIRDAFTLLQADGDLTLTTADNSTIPPDQLRLLNQLHRNVIIINSVSYLLSDDLEDFAAEAGILKNQFVLKNAHRSSCLIMRVPDRDSFSWETWHGHHILPIPFGRITRILTNVIPLLWYRADVSTRFISRLVSRSETLIEIMTIESGGKDHSEKVLYSVSGNDSGKLWVLICFSLMLKSSPKLVLNYFGEVLIRLIIPFHCTMKLTKSSKLCYNAVENNRCSFITLFQRISPLSIWWNIIQRRVSACTKRPVALPSSLIDTWQANY